MKYIAVAALLAALCGCRGEPTPRDYQNAPPAMTHPPDSKKEAPSAGATGTAPPQPTTGVEGTAAPYEPAGPPTGTSGTTGTTGTKAEDQAPVTNT